MSQQRNTLKQKVAQWVNDNDGFTRGTLQVLKPQESCESFKKRVEGMFKEDFPYLELFAQICHTNSHQVFFGTKFFTRR